MSNNSPPKEKMLTRVIWHLFFGDLSQSEKLSEIKPPLATPKPKKCLATFRRGAREGGSDRLLPCSESVLPFRGPRSCFADNCTFGDFGCLRHTHQGGILDRRDPGPNEGV